MAEMPAVNPIVRSQLMQFCGQGELQEAVKEWYLQLDEAEKRQVEEAALTIATTFKQESRQPFGVASALELMAALIAFDQGWLDPALDQAGLRSDDCKARRLRLKYGRGKRKLQYRRELAGAGG